MKEYNTYNEYLRHPKFMIVVTQVKFRSQGRCEKILKNGDRCTNADHDTHHTKYCAWGDFDNVDNLIRLCRSCHEAEHTCLTCQRILLKAKHIKKGLKKCDDCA